MAMTERAQTRRCWRGIATGFVVVAVFLCISVTERVSAADGMEEPRSIRKTCGVCPEGYATTGRTNAPEVCKDGDPVLVQCVPVGCGSADGGLVSQCQSQQPGASMPDPNQGGVRCPPDCGSTAAPGQGASPPPPKFRPTPESR